MIVYFAESRLEALYVSGRGAGKFPEPVVNSFLRRVRALEAALDDRDLRAQKSLHFEALKGKSYGGRHSVRLNEKWRLIIEITGAGAQRSVTIHEISNHYGD
ncbi:MAG: type II toxin-antitoxin system RelE/ParE family toxin [Thermoanaerobaculia bacterium]